MQLKLNERQYNILKVKREAFDRAKYHGSFEGLEFNWRREFALVYGELFGIRNALNYQCGDCLLSALRQFQPLMVDFENCAAEAQIIQIPIPELVEKTEPIEQSELVEELVLQEREHETQVQAIVNNLPKFSRAEKLAAESRARRNK
jgi:hypothetical protein